MIGARVHLDRWSPRTGGEKKETMKDWTMGMEMRQAGTEGQGVTKREHARRHHLRRERPVLSEVMGRKRWPLPD